MKRKRLAVLLVLIAGLMGCSNIKSSEENLNRAGTEAGYKKY